MEEDVMESPDIGRDPEWKNKKQNNRCVINIFCDDKHGWDHDGKDDGNCVINIFCGEKKHGCDHDGNCVINIFCGEKKHEEPCDDKKPACKL